METTNVVIIDDHHLLREGLVRLINSFDGFQVIFDGYNGLDLKENISEIESIDIAVLDIKMPGMDGFETAEWLTQSYPQIAIVALSIYNDLDSIYRMISKGAKGYILKDAEPEEFEKALIAIRTNGHYHSPIVSKALMTGLQGRNHKITLSQREEEFLRLICSEKTYKEIAKDMFVSPRTVENYRDSLLKKLGVKNRVGLVLYAVEHGYYTFDS